MTSETSFLLMKKKKEEKYKFRLLKEVAKETAQLISKLTEEVVSKTWEIGKIVAEKRKEINPQYGDYFHSGIAEELLAFGIDLKPSTLDTYERFYSKFPTLSRILKETKLTAGQLKEISHVQNGEFEKV